MKKLKESYEPEVENGLYNRALMNLDDVRKNLPNNAPKEIYNLYQQLHAALEKENYRDSNGGDTNGSLTVFIQKVNPSSENRYFRDFQGKTFELEKVHRISPREGIDLGVEDCDYVGYLELNGRFYPLPFARENVNSKIPYAYDWIDECFIRSGNNLALKHLGMIQRRNNVRLNESQLRSLIKESIKNVLK